jgi:hypothetical protein
MIASEAEYQVGLIGTLAWVHVLAADIPSGALVTFISSESSQKES